jgi:acyl-CoA synthetase (AMP-forming)/AMP-acid ligase II
MNMQGYYNEPKLTAQIVQGEYIYTNDIGYYDEDGYLYMIGRQDDVINIGGLKIAPTEVEDVALRFEGIAECACFAVEDRMGGSIPKLVVVMKQQMPFDASAIQQFLGQYLETFKVPKRIEQISTLPYLPNGKVNRKKLCEIEK